MYFLVYIQCIKYLRHYPPAGSELGPYTAGDLENYGWLNLGPTGKTLDAPKKFKNHPVYIDSICSFLSQSLSACPGRRRYRCFI